MTGLSRVLVAIVALALATASVGPGPVGAEQASPQGAAAVPIQIAQVPRGGERRGPMSEADREKMRQQMIERMLDQADLTAKEKAAARKTLRAKDQARKVLQAELTDLRRVANKEKPSAKELQGALAAYRKAVAQYRSKIQAEDVALTKQLSVRSQLRCMSLGILDNGLGLMGMARGRAGSGGSGGQRPRQ